MPRLPVPDDHERGSISVAGSKDLAPRSADVQTDAVDHARDLSVREDERGRYVGVSEHYADEVAAFLGVDAPGTDEDGGDADDETEDGSADEGTTEEDSDAEPESVADAGVEHVEQSIDDGVCPWCDDYEGDGVPQHASSAHPESWSEYKEATA